MDAPALISKYDFGMAQGGLIGFTAQNEIYSEIMFSKKLSPVSGITEVRLKKAAMSPKICIDMKYNDNGKEKMFQSVYADSADEKGVQFVKELRSKLSSTTPWKDERKIYQDFLDLSEPRVYDLQIMFFLKSKGFAGSGRTMQIIMNYFMLCITTLFITTPLLIYVIAAKCHQVRTDGDGISIKKLLATVISWEDVTSVEPQKYVITKTGQGAYEEVTLINFFVNSKDGKKHKFTIRSYEAKAFMNEIIARKKAPAEYAGWFL
ncbi:MAG: hypothetical protein ACJ75J_13770 [Cytophagaceae bacterium]